MSKQICDTPIRQAVTAGAEIVAGVAKLVNEFEHTDELSDECAEKIIAFVLANKRIHELVH